MDNIYNRESSGYETNITTIIFNCNSIYKKVGEIKEMLSNTKPDLLCLTETWINKSKPKFCGYSSEWKHRLQQTGGGIGILIREDIPYQNLQLDPYKDGILEIQAIKISTTRFENITIFNIYNPNKNLSLQEIMHYLAQTNEPVMIVGDFNSHSPLLETKTKYSNITGKTIENLLLKENLYLINSLNMFTYLDRRTGNQSCLDLCIVSANLAPLTTMNPFLDMGSDHISLIVTVDIKPNRLQKMVKSRWKTTNEKLIAFSNEYIPPKIILPNDIDTTVMDFTKRLSNTADQVFGEKTTKISSAYTRKTAWWNEECRLAVKQRRKARNNFGKHPTKENLLLYKEMNNKTTDILLQCKEKSFSEFISTMQYDTPQSVVWSKIKILKSGYTDNTRNYPILNNNQPVTNNSEKLTYLQIILTISMIQTRITQSLLRKLMSISLKTKTMK